MYLLFDGGVVADDAQVRLQRDELDDFAFVSADRGRSCWAGWWRTGVISSRRLGNTRLVKAAHSPLTGPLTELLLRSFGPRQVLAEELAGLDGIEAAYLFGSWAARYAGQEGRAPADLDVLIIGRPDRDALDAAPQRARARLAPAVTVTIRSLQWWRDGADSFHAEVTRRPLVPLLESGGLS